MTKDQHLVKAALDLEAAWGKAGFDLFMEIVKLKRLCGQAAFCLAALYSGRTDGFGALANDLFKASRGVEIPALEGMTPEEIADFGRRVLEHYPTATFIGGTWKGPQ